MAAMNASTTLPPLPAYTLTSLPPLVPPVPDKLLALLLPIGAYWLVSMVFHWIDINDYLSKYRLHTPAEILKRNHASRYDVARDVIVQQVIQTIVGGTMNMLEPEDTFGKESYDLAVWAQRIRIAQKFIPSVLAVLSIDANGLAKSLAAYPSLAGALIGGVYPSQHEATLLKGVAQTAPSFMEWELQLAQAIYWVLVPALQFFVAVVVLDTWQYFLHRAMHMNKWLYTTFHARHHRLYVPYAYGALYNHPFEGFLLDSLGGAIAFKVAMLSTRQSMWFFTGATIKTVDDHCGYSLPWDPLQRITANNSGYHDVHHQSWGIKTNFSQPFFTFWDRILGTKWSGGDVSARYERDALAAQRKVDADVATELKSRRRGPSITGSDAKQSISEDPHPYANATANSPDLQQFPTELLIPVAPEGKATQQAAASRQQVLEDTSLAGGPNVLIEEAQEEVAAEMIVGRDSEEGIADANGDVTDAASPSTRKGHRRRTASSLTGSDGLRGLRQRVNMHGRTGSILGMDHTH